MAFNHQAGSELQCLCIPIIFNKELCRGPSGEELYKCGFKIGGGIDLDFTQSPQGFRDNGIYVTEIHPCGPAAAAGLQVNDKILQCQGYDFTMVTHSQAVNYIKKGLQLNLLVARYGVTSVT